MNTSKFDCSYVDLYFDEFAEYLSLRSHLAARFELWQRELGKEIFIVSELVHRHKEILEL